MAEPAASRCDRCGGSGYLCFPSGSAARARVCACVSACPLCGGTGHRIRRDEAGYEYASVCRCQALETRVERFNRAALPSKFFDKTLFNFEPDSKSQEGVQSALYQFLRSFRPGDRGFVLMGPVGTGKTHLLSAVVAYLTLELGISARFVDFFQLVQDLRDGFSQNRSGNDLLAPLEDVPVLAVDELGKGRNTEWELSILDEIISKRYNQQRTTLFTTNYTDDPETTFALAVQEPRANAPRARTPGALDRRVVRETLEERVGARIYSRLREMCVFHTVAGPDRRAQATEPPRS